tara:strand:+ start:653 stop:1144 length:492 start_codon:yes stop_codon:yes gene_type:complete
MESMMHLLFSKPVYIVLRLIIGGIFIVAGATKIMDVDTFAMAIDGYGLVSWRIANVIARTLPALEIVAGLGLVFDVRGSLGTIVVQLLGFMGVLAYGIYMGLDVDCGCFGPGDPGSGEPGGLWGTFIRDAFMLGACLLMYWQRQVAGYTPLSLTRFIQSRKEE